MKMKFKLRGVNEKQTIVVEVKIQTERGYLTRSESYHLKSREQDRIFNALRDAGFYCHEIKSIKP